MNYLSEENYQKINKTIKTVGVIIMIIGLLLISMGIYYLIKSSNVIEPNMSNPNWFQVSSNKMHLESSGMFMLLPGIFLLIVGSMVRFVIANQRKILAYKMSEMMPIAKEGVDKVVPTMVNVSKEVTKEMAPLYGEVAKEITKGIKEGMKEDK